MNSRPPPPTGAPPPYAFVGRMYRRSLRPVVMSSALLAAFWSFLWGGSALANLSTAKDLKPVNAALGALYLTIGMIEIQGFIAALKQNLLAARIFTYLSVFAALSVTAAESLRFSVYFTHKHELINTCTSQATGVTVETFGSFWGNGAQTETLSASDAAQYCQDAWNHSIWSEVAWLIVATVLGLVFASISFSYYHQLLVPQQIPPSQQVFALGQVQPPYGPYNPQGGYQYPAPPGLPPRHEDYVPPYDPAKVPAYEARYGNARPEEKALPTDSSETLTAGSARGAQV